MKCPNDSATLVMSERTGIEIDHCPQRRGVWLDRGEHDKIIDRAGSAPAAGGSSAALPSAPAATMSPGVPYSEPRREEPYGSQSGQHQYRQQGPGPNQGYGDHGDYRKRKRENWLSELFD